MARLSTKRRKSLPKGSFAVPSKRKYPIDTKARARNALARVSQHGSSAEKAAVRRKVKSKYPSIKVGGKKTTRRKKR